KTFPTKIQQGLLLHRSIDSFTDLHPAVSRAKIFFRATYELYAGPIVDIVFDHFLANDPKCFISEKNLYDFSQQVYHCLEKNQDHFPDKFSKFFPYMKTQNWLYEYRTLKGIKQSLHGLHQRAQHMPEPEKAYEILVSHYYQLNQIYYEFIDDVMQHVKVALSAP